MNNPAVLLNRSHMAAMFVSLGIDYLLNLFDASYYRASFV